jgi:hypothetical protein
MVCVIIYQNHIGINPESRHSDRASRKVIWKFCGKQMRLFWKSAVVLRKSIRLVEWHLEVVCIFPIGMETKCTSSAYEILLSACCLLLSDEDMQFGLRSRSLHWRHWQSPTVLHKCDWPVTEGVHRCGQLPPPQNFLEDSKMHRI